MRFCGLSVVFFFHLRTQNTIWFYRCYTLTQSIRNYWQTEEMERRREAIICNYCLHQVCSCSLILIHFRLSQLKKIIKYCNKGMVFFLEGLTGRQIKSINQTDTRLRWFSLFCFIKAVAWKRVGRINPDTANLQFMWLLYVGRRKGATTSTSRFLRCASSANSCMLRLPLVRCTLSYM